MRKISKVVAGLFTGSVLVMVSTHAGAAVNPTSNPESFPAAATITNGAGTNAIGTSLDNAGGHILTAGESLSATYHDYTTVKSWADLAIDLGWMHSVDWVQLNVTEHDTYLIKDEVIGLRNVAGTWVNQDTSIHPAFSVWSLTGNSFSSAAANNPISVQSPLAYGYTTGGNNSNMGFNQVASPSLTNNGKFLLAGGVNDIVGYSNSGVSGWYNGNGDLVGSGSAGASSGANGDGFLWTDLKVYLTPGSYLIAIGGSCVDLVNCGPVTAINPTTGAKSWGTGWHQLTVSAVPAPATLWLFATALAGTGIFGRRRAKA